MSLAEIHSVDSDAFDPAGGDRMVVYGRNLTGLTSVLLGLSPCNDVTPWGVVPSFDGTNDQLYNALPITNYVSATAGSIACLFYARSAVTDTGSTAYYAMPGLFMNDANGYLGLTFSTSGVRLGSYDAVSRIFDSVAATCTVGEWHLAQARWNATTLEVRVDGGTWQTLAKEVTLNTDGLSVGKSYNGSNWLNGRIRDLLSAQSRLDDATFNNLLGYVNKRYGLALGGVAPNTYDPAVLTLTGWWRSSGYAAGTWTGTASAGNSASRNLTEATNPPALVTGEIARTFYSVSVKNASGTGCLANAVQYANPGTVQNCVWWLRPDDADVDVNGSVEVTAWRDRSGVGDSNRDLGNGAVTDKPSWNTADANYGNKPTVGTFNKAGSADDCKLFSSAWSTTYTTYTMSLIGHAINASNRYFTYESASQYNALLNATGTPRVYAGDATPTIGVAAGDLSRYRSYFSAVFNAASSKLYFDDNPPTNGDLVAHTLGFSAVGVGNHSTATNFGVERIADLFVHSRVLTQREQRTLRKYRDSYYGQVD